MEMLLNLALAALPASDTGAIEKPMTDGKTAEADNAVATPPNPALDWASVFNATLMAAVGGGTTPGDTAKGGALGAENANPSADLALTNPLEFPPSMPNSSPPLGAVGLSLSDEMMSSEVVVSSGKALLSGVLQQAKLNQDIQDFQISTKPVLAGAAENAAVFDLRNFKEQLGQAKNFGVERSAGRKPEETLSKHRVALTELSAAVEVSALDAKQSKALDQEALMIKEASVEMNDQKSQTVEGLSGQFSDNYDSSFAKFDSPLSSDKPVESSAVLEDPAWLDSMRQQMDLAKLKNSDVLRIDVMLRDDQKLGLEANIKDGVLMVRFDANTNMKEMLGGEGLEHIMSVMLESAPEVKEVRFEQKSVFESQSKASAEFTSSDSNGGRSSKEGQGGGADQKAYAHSGKTSVEVLNTPISSVKHALQEGRTSWRA